ncbi:RNA-binding S4 domain-containing protein [Allocoprobacillus halotolerans]|uniref:RNA-binding S4 domain-containing protein n=1 Tax=Allocoprobacillus halotolerans TaxID=2944914 RepID=A0ABY5I609_9FIRM|nr:RNA-binding S4 domain-containing protein [Allocoprobacillus halotolerans]UTY40420.1 RNA-binding S4 domain-containing protein [Allocoprobacillus halotolerans]
MKAIKIYSDYITLGQLLKLADAGSSGAEAKIVIGDGLVLVNGEVETRRGKKLYHQDIVSFNGEDYQINNED